MMTHISVLYAEEDEALAERIAAALARAGYDARPASEALAPGPVLVLWTRRSAASPRIVRLARSAMAAGALIPVKVAGAAPGPEFAALAPADLSGWTGDDDDPRWRFVIEEAALIAARRRLGDGDVWDGAPAEAPPSPSQQGPSPPAGAPYASRGADDEAVGFHFDPPPRRAAFRLSHLAYITAGVLIGATGFALITAPTAFSPGDLLRAFAPEERKAPQETARTAATSPGSPSQNPVQETPQDRPENRPEPSPNPAILGAVAAGVPASDDAPARSGTDPDIPPPLRDVEPIAVAPAPKSAAPKSAAPKPAPQAEPAAVVGEETPHTDGQSARAGAGSDLEAGFGTGLGTGGGYLRDCVSCPDMAIVPAGRFLMGSPPGERARHETEGPLAMVDIVGGFAMAVRETTMAQWDACVADGGCRGYTPPAHGWGRGDQPVVSVSFEDAQRYADWLSRKTGRDYRLPSEAEWEYAARAGASGPFSFGASLTPARANYNAAYAYGGPVGTGLGRAVATGSYAPNGFGLYDMHGNVWEWTADCWADSHRNTDVHGAPRDGGNGGDCARRVLKGGAWNTGGWRLRAAHRIGKPATAREFDNGFRVVRDLD